MLRKSRDGSWLLSFGEVDRSRAARLEQFCSWVNEQRGELLPNKERSPFMRHSMPDAWQKADENP